MVCWYSSILAVVAIPCQKGFDLVREHFCVPAALTFHSLHGLFLFELSSRGEAFNSKPNHIPPWYARTWRKEVPQAPVKGIAPSLK